MLKNWSIGKKLALGFGVLIFLVLLLGGISIYFLFSINRDVRSIEHRVEKINGLFELHDTVFHDSLASVSHMILSSNSDEVAKFIAKLKECRDEAKEAIEELKRLTKHPEGKRLLSQMISRFQDIEKTFDAIISAVQEKDFKKAIEIYKKDLKEKEEALVSAFIPLKKYYQNELKRREHEINEIVKEIIMIILGFTILSIIFGIMFAGLISSSIKKPVSRLQEILRRIREGDFTVRVDIEGRDEIGMIAQSLREMLGSMKNLIGEVKSVSGALASSAEELSSITKQFSSSVETQTEKATQIASAAEEMSVTVVDIAKNTSNILEESVTTSKVAKEGEEMTEKTAEEIKAIEAATERLQSIMGVLEERSRQIENVVTFIKDVAEQTNLLALNATIEAARAGEHGKSFAVVAGEIRKLAERTNKSTDEIAKVIKEIQQVVVDVKKEVEAVNSKVITGVELSEEASKILNEIANKAENLQQMIQSIASATEEMSTVADQIAQDINKVAEASRELNQGIEQTVQTAEEVAKLGTELKDAVEKFKV